MLLAIEKLIYGGDGLARTRPDADGRSMAVFVPFVLPGEKIEAEIRQEKRGFARGSALQIIEASPDRIEARCPYFQKCGGCHYQHILYEQQLLYKSDILRETLQRIAKVALPSDIQLHPSPPFNYRNRTRLQVRTTPQFALGYFRFGSHEFLEVCECPISSPLINRVIARLIEIRGADCPTGMEELELFADAADEHLLAWAICGRDSDQKDLLRWADAIQREIPELLGMACFASRRNSTKSQVNDDEEPMGLRPVMRSGAQSLPYRTATHTYQVSAGAFFQVNRHLVDELIAVVTGNVRGDIALDLYAGVGLFSVPLAESFRHIYGVEASLTSHADFIHNVPANVKAVGARTEDYLAKDYLKSRGARGSVDLVILDPPRAGAGAVVIRSLVQLGAPGVRYVSCDPSTLARDIAPLLAAGYRIDEAHLFDLFPETFHIETVLLLSR